MQKLTVSSCFLNGNKPHCRNKNVLQRKLHQIGLYNDCPYDTSLCTSVRLIRLSFIHPHKHQLQLLLNNNLYFYEQFIHFTYKKNSNMSNKTTGFRDTVEERSKSSKRPTHYSGIKRLIVANCASHSESQQGYMHS